MADSLLGLEDKVCLVTGSGQGMGEGIATVLAEAGCHAAVVDLNPEKAERVAAKIRGMGRRAIALTADARSEDAVRKMVEDTVSELGGLDIGVCNIGGLSQEHPALVVDSSLEFWDYVVNQNLRSTYLCSREMARSMVERGVKGAIVNIASISGLRASARLSPYGASKAGIMHYTQTLAMELAPRGIRVNCVSPASINTPEALGHSGRTEMDASVIPIGRAGQPEDIGFLVAMLASDRAGYVTGQTIHADGGLSCTSARPQMAGG